MNPLIGNERELEIVLQIDGYDLYELGKSLGDIEHTKLGETNSDAFSKCIVGSIELQAFVKRSAFISGMRLVNKPANDLLHCLGQISEKIKGKEGGEIVEAHWVYRVKSLKDTFETILKAEFQNCKLFIPTRKGGYDITVLIESGDKVFPDALAALVPAAIEDIKAATRCLAFELFTATGFHLHRANESVILAYYDKLSGGAARPSNRNLGAYIKELAKHNAPSIVVSCLEQAKDLHRNPLMHPDQSIESADEAIALLNTIHTSITAMLRELA